MELSIRFKTRVDWRKTVSKSSVRSPLEFKKVMSPNSSCNMACLDALSRRPRPRSPEV
jgi:hypothetical protein